MYFAIALAILIPHISGKYFDTSKSDIFAFPANDTSYFGYSLQLQHHSKFGSRIIVGAPKATSTIGSNDYQNGRVYSCNIPAKTCVEIRLNQNELQMNYTGLGSSVDAEETENGFVVACAPRWSNLADQSTLGMCYSHNPAVAKELRPLNKSALVHDGSYYSQFGQAGFSAHLVQGGSHSVVLGAPGVLAWTGTVAMYEDLNTVGDSNVAQAFRADKRTSESAYFGYSISSGKFNASNREQIFYVSGAPRNYELYGSVNVFEFDKNGPFKNKYELRGNQYSQFGEYFGASLAVGDIDGDLLDDIIVGAPTYSVPSEGSLGSIYVFHSMRTEVDRLQFKLDKKIAGHQVGSRFGTAISYLGDVNNDGYGDVAVGAPYYDNTGAVFIYFGGEKGLELNYKQKIFGSEIDRTLRGFGFSLSRGLDIDNNTNNDLAVGAYLSNQVVLLKSKPVINIKTKISLDQNSQLNTKTKKLLIKYCVNYKADARLDAYNINLFFDINKKEATFENGENHWTKEVQMRGIDELCEEFNILVHGQILETIKLDLNYNISSATLPDKLIPFEEQHLNSVLYIPFNKECASEICKPNLILTADFEKINGDLIIGSTSELNLIVNIQNLGDHSYDNKLVIQVHPKQLNFLSFPNYCVQLNNLITCLLKYPIIQNETKQLKFVINATKLNVADKILIANVTVNDKRQTTKEVPLRSDVNLEIFPKSQPEEINNLTGIQTFYHEYNIENIGITRIEKLQLGVFIPYEVKLSEFLHSFDLVGCSTITIFNESDSKNPNNTGLFPENLGDNTLFINCTTRKTNVRCRKILCDLETNSRSFKINVTMKIDVGVLGGLQNEGPIVLSTVLEPDFKFIPNYFYTWTKLITKQKGANIRLYLGISILVAVLLVAVLITVLYKCGFFKRKEVKRNSNNSTNTNNSNKSETAQLIQNLNK